MSPLGITVAGRKLPEALYPTTILGVYCGEVHLLPFRTEKLSPPAQMVLGNRESMSMPLLKSKAPPKRGAFFVNQSLSAE